jgi:hypothetical protein
MFGRDDDAARSCTGEKLQAPNAKHQRNFNNQPLKHRVGFSGVSKTVIELDLER